MEKGEKKTIQEAIGNITIARNLSGFILDDPYEICFALIYLLDTGDDAPWLFNSGMSLMFYAVNMLPWHMDTSSWDDGDVDEWFNSDIDDRIFDRNGWTQKDPPKEQIDFYHDKHGGRNLAQVIYDLCGGIVPVGMHPFEEDRIRMISEGMKEETARKITDIADIMFLSQFQANQHELDFLLEEDQEGGDDQNNEESEIIKEKQQLQEEIKSLKKQVKNLNSSLAASRKEAEREKENYEKELKVLRMEHRELADLRDLVFNRDNEEAERPEKAEVHITYPYTTRKRTVVFGGHDSFLKVIKPMLPSVRFIEAEKLAFSPDIIRNADVVWVQSNCISHSQFGSIVKNCKQAGVQLRYFGYASAEKCAEQLVREDAGYVM
jgi:hypothetical protein